MTNLKKIIFFLFFLSLSSCAYYEKIFIQDQYVFNPKVVPSSDALITDVWSVDTGDGRSSKSTVLQPSFDEDKNIYTIDSDGLIVSINSQTGNKNWSQNLNLDVTSGITSYKNIIFFGTSRGILYAFDIKNLKDSDDYLGIDNIPFISDSLPVTPKWHYQLKSEAISPVVGSYKNIFVKTSDGNMLSLDVDEGTLDWKNIGRNIPLSIRGSGSAAVDYENIYLARDDGTLISLLQESGKLNWFVSISAKSGRNELESLRDVEMSPYVDSGIIYVGSFQGNLIAVDSISGSLLWSSPISIVTDIDVDNENVFASSADGNLYALDKYNGEIVWKTQLTERIGLLQPVIIEDTVVVMNESGYASVINKSTGDILKYEKITGEIDHQIKVLKTNKNFFILEKSGRLTAFSIGKRNYEDSGFFSW